MSVHRLPAALIAALCTAAPALADLRGPAELPPASYQGQQYVDSRGCVFLRAGYGGQVTWVPRVTRDREQLCGYPGSGGAVDVAPEALPVAAAPEPRLAELPAPAAPRPEAAPQPKAEAPVAPAPRIAVVPAATSAKYPDPAPPAGWKKAWKDDRLNPNRGKQTVAGVQDQDEIWTRTSPMVLREDWGKPKAPLTIIVRRADGSEARYDGVVVSTKGDGRLVVRLADGKDSTVVVPPQVTKSSKNSPAAAIPAAPKAGKVAKATAPVTAGQKLYVRVGAYGVQANADKAAGKLRGLGLKVARGKAKGGAVQLVYAGPFATRAEAKAALSAARGGGFPDAVMVQ